MKTKVVKGSSWLIAVIIIFGSLFQCLTVARSGLKYEYGLGFWGPTGRDLVWHQALVGQLIKGVPPQNPGLAGEKLVNYHYFYDLLVAVAHKMTGVSVENLIYRFFPVLFSILFGIGTYYLSKKLFNSRSASIISLFFAYFGGSFGWIVEWIKYRKLGGESAFWMNQPVSMNLNPPFAISIILVIALLLLWSRYFKKTSFSLLFMLATLTFVLFYFKSYAGLIMIFAFLYSWTSSLIQKKWLDMGIGLLIFIGLLGLIFWLNRGSIGSFEWQPFWLVNSAISFPDRVEWVRLSSAIGNYILGKNYPKLFLAEFLALAIFLVGNLGLRTIGFLALIDKKIRSNNLVQLIVFLSLVSLVPSLLFVQIGSAWNTIQFGYYFLYFASLFSGFTLAKIIQKFPFTIYLLPFTLLITAISSFTTFTFGLYKNPPAKLTPAEYGALNYLKSQPGGVVLTHPYNPSLREQYQNPYPLSVYTNTDYVAAFSGKAAYLGDIEQQKILGTDYEKRLNYATLYFTSSTGMITGIDYVYLPKIFRINLNKSKGLNKIFENDEVLIYRVINSILD